MADPQQRRSILRGAVLLVLGATVPASAGGGLAIVGATVFDGGGGPALSDGVVVIQGETIGEVGPRSHVALPKGIPYIDGRRLFVVPGRIADPGVRAALRQRLSQGTAFEQALADALHADASSGSIAPRIGRGRPADLLLLDKDPRLSLENIASVRRVFVRGREKH